MNQVKAAAGPPLSADRTLGALASITASRIAREFKMGGVGHTVSCGESSGLQALELAVRSLQDRSLDLAVAGGVDFSGDLRALDLALAEDFPGQVPFQGFTPAEGAAAVVLQRLSDAEKEGRPILAVIRGLSSAQVQWNPEHQDEPILDPALSRACLEAGIDYRDLEFLETTDLLVSGLPHSGENHARMPGRGYRLYRPGRRPGRPDPDRAGPG